MPESLVLTVKVSALLCYTRLVRYPSRASYEGVRGQTKLDWCCIIDRAIRLVALTGPASRSPRVVLVLAARKVLIIHSL
jgi:hypothetical protein